MKTAWLKTLPAAALTAALVLRILPVQASGAVRVVAGIAPLADLVRFVGGSEVEVFALFPPGVHPRESSPSLPPMAERGEGMLYLKVGGGLEGRADRLLAEKSPGPMTIVDLSTSLELIGRSVPEEAERKIFAAALGVDEGPAERRGNLFYWLDPAIVRSLVDQIEGSLTAFLPAGRETFQANALLLKERLGGLDEVISLRLAGAKGRPFASFSGAWSYFSRRYGLRQEILTAVVPGGGPGRRSLKGAVSRIRSLGIETIFTDSFFPRQPAVTTARRAGVRLVVLEPFGSPAHPGYFEMMRHNLDLIADAL